MEGNETLRGMCPKCGSFYTVSVHLWKTGPADRILMKMTCLDCKAEWTVNRKRREGCAAGEGDRMMEYRCS